jgi:ABC-2 type transport system ATP-binding protein
MLTNAGTFVRGADAAALESALNTAGLTFSHERDGGFVVEATTEQVGKAALVGGVVLTELRTGGSGLEDMFLELTADDAREEVRS